jgi:hypothetical protein
LAAKKTVGRATTGLRLIHQEWLQTAGHVTIEAGSCFRYQYIGTPTDVHEIAKNDGLGEIYGALARMSGGHRL